MNKKVTGARFKKLVGRLKKWMGDLSLQVHISCQLSIATYVLHF
jgi:hypothetical protein